MYELSVEREFHAFHALVIQGEREASHDHIWRVTLFVRGEQLDDDGLLCDFHDLERALDAVLAPFHDADLNVTPPFDQNNPTADCVARHIGEAVAIRIEGKARVDRVSVTEAPGCAATYFPSP